MLENINQSRRGPLSVFKAGKYVGNRIEDIIKKDPYYFIWAVKEWLNISPEQASLFEEVTNGGTIPKKYIVSPTRKEEPLVYIPYLSWGPEGVCEVKNPVYCIPNYDFDPDLAPDFWKEFKKALTPEMGEAERGNLFRRLQDEYNKKCLALYLDEK